jgi:hypothetical protein
MDETLRKYTDAIACARAVPDYLQRQVNGIRIMESDFSRGLATLQEGIEIEMDYLEEVWKKSYSTEN